MTGKQKLALIAAQYVAEARERTRQGDLLAEIAKVVTEDSAQTVFAELLKLGLVDENAVLTEKGQNTKAGNIRVN